MSSEDLTARARIREAAITLFSERGIGPATIRDIAQAAGVSSGLVRHHFGSKEGLRDACDEYALNRAALLRQELLDYGRLGDQGFVGSVHPESMRLQAYLMRSMGDGSAAGDAIFELNVQAGVAWLAGTEIKTVDPRAYSAVLVAMKSGMWLLREQIGRALGADVTQPAGHARVLRAALEVFTQPMLTDAQVEQALQAVDRLHYEEENHD